VTQSVQLGPLALPLAPLVLAVAAIFGLALGKRLGRKVGVDAEPALLRMFWLGLLASRAGFVWQWRGSYFTAPWTMLDIRDGGWEPVAGFAAAFLYGLMLVQRQSLLRRPIVAASMALLLGWTAGAVALAVLTLGDPQALPALSLPAMKGESVTLAGFAGKPTVVNLWATWCPPCRREMPLLRQAQAAHPEIHFVFVNQGETREDIDHYLQGEGLQLQNVLIDARRATGAVFKESALPTTFFFNAQGLLVATRIGALSQATLGVRLSAIQAPAP
jgi:thiol-disulfide isomerase/thioredoxin